MPDTAPAVQLAEPQPETAPAADRSTVESSRLVAWLSQFRWPVALAALAALLVVAGSWCQLRLAAQRDSPAQTNTALVDSGRTAQVSATVSSAVNQIFSYSYHDTAATERAAAGVLTGQAASQYRTLFGAVTRNAGAQQLQLTTKVTNIGVDQLTPNSAQLLVFCDQTTVRGDGRAPTVAAAELTVTAVYQSGHWLISDISAS